MTILQGVAEGLVDVPVASPGIRGSEGAIWRAYVEGEKTNPSPAEKMSRAVMKRAGIRLSIGCASFRLVRY